MVGIAIVRKAAKKGYKRYGIPGAVAAGVGTFLGIRLLKRKFGSESDSDNQSNKSGEQPDAAN